ncbi:ATP-dependent helicase/nuclease subunit A [Posidoniimonas polymericola]|uniref:DNA 3'-5' helicase n=1 Tax=Posidoniimonas polymericola TaxID=2528002 RepID=A0A5C5YQ10_9BACT|nr:UvrD-helicase domain-containing protein [Posidoniimonas polymericola]TWT77031.1 ATP-dependent helicase/nuclease subunit A [Posidoniimonas polymericola]
MSRLSYTNEQSAAIETRGVSIALDAGAGCGKTFVLTERFLAQLAPGDDALELHELVAITFTEAAAREMRERVRGKCLERLAAAAADEAPHWLRLLRSLDAARVSTIHAFCSTLVRNYALELRLDPSFQVLDQAAADVLLSESTDRRLRSLLDDRDADVITLAAEFGFAGLKSRVKPLRDYAGGFGLGEWAARPPEEMVAAWRDYFRKVVAPLELQQLAEDPAIDEIRSLIPECTGEAETRGKLAALDTALNALRQGETELDVAQLRKLAMVQGVCGKKNDWPSPDTKKLYGDACKRLRDRIDKLSKWADHEQQLEAAILGQRLARVTTAVVQEYTKAKRAASALDFNDLLGHARRLLTDESLRDVRRRIERSATLLLVDEFQDTDQAQVDIVTAIAGDALTTGGLFFVGDFKQSIYRFRGAQPTVFRELQGKIPDEGRLPLSQNFRSQPAVLEFVNELFAPLFGADYLPLRPARPQVGPKPAVQFLWSDAPPETNAEAGRRAEAQRVAVHVRQLLDDPTPRVAERVDGEWTARRVLPGDIAILFRALGDVQHYEQALRDAGVDHHLIGGHAFYSQQEVYDLLNLLRSVTSTCDEVSLAGVLRSPFFALQDETLLWLTRAGGSLNAGLLRTQPIKELSNAQQERVAAARDVLTDLRQRKGVANTAELIRLALDRTGYDAALLSEFLGERKLANLEKIIEQARVADQTRPGDVDAFVRQLTEFIASQPKEANAATADEDASVVRLMTVHHSKGLEFPVVFVADLARKSSPDRSVAAFDADLGPLVKPTNLERGVTIGLELHKKAQTRAEREELVRLLYVACTRAADLLILSAAVEDIEQPKGEWLKRLAEVFNLQTGAAIDSQTVHAEIVPPTDWKPADAQRQRRPDVPKLVRQALRKPAPPAGHIGPIGVNPSELKRFSVSRLTGRFHLAADQRLAEPAPADDAEPIDPRGLGTLVHAVMERIDFAHPTRVRQWCESLAPRRLRRNWRAGAEEAEQLINRFLASDRCRQLASAERVEREVEFVMPWTGGGSLDGPALLQGYIDCLVEVSPGEWQLLDYKTNRVTPGMVPQAAEAYRLQMSVYALAIEATLHKSPAALTLHFLRPGAETSFPWDDDARRWANAAIDDAIQSTREAAAVHG